jgi:hypothetical protein
MSVNVDDLWVFRIIPIQNLEADLRKGLYSKNSAPEDPTRVIMGNKEIIGERDNRIVKCYPGTVVNDYVPFYFSVRTPMLFNIKTGQGVPRMDQKDIVYLCFKMTDLTSLTKPWCFTDGNAAKRITKFYNDLKHINKVDWVSINSEDFRHVNSDGDEDRIRKKHAEFLVQDKVPRNKIKGIVVLNNQVKAQAEAIVAKCNLEIEVKVKSKFYF